MVERDSGDYTPWWAIDRAAWREKFSMVFKFASISKDRDKPLKPWTQADIDAFINSDPVYGPQLRLVKQGAKVATTGAVIGGLLTAGISVRYSKSPHGAVLSLLAGSAVGWAVGEEVANLAYGLYKFDRMDTNLKFLEWWKEKTEGSGA
eukprot:c27739_g3_i1 orf=159-605(-)